MWKEDVTATSFFDFDYTLLRFSMDPLCKLNREERWVDIPVTLGDERHIVRVEGHGTTSQPKFRVYSESVERKDELMAHIRNLFQWDRDLEKIHEHFLDTNLDQLFNAHPGTPIVKDFHLYDCLMKTIIHQQLNMKFAFTLSTRFVQKYGEQIDGVWFYPKPERVAEIDYTELRELQFSQRKAEYVIDTSKMIADGELDLEELAQKEDDEVMKRLTKVRGLGPWTAENWLLFGVGRADLLPKADIGIQNALKFYFDREDKPSIPEITEMSKGWEPYRSYASLTLWRSIEG